MVNNRCLILMKNRVRPDSPLFNSLGCNRKGREWGVPLPSWLVGLGEHCKLPSGVRGRAPAEKLVLEYLELENTHLISLSLTFSIFPDFSLTTLEFSDFSRFSRWVVTVCVLLHDYFTTKQFVIVWFCCASEWTLCNTQTGLLFSVDLF